MEGQFFRGTRPLGKSPQQRLVSKGSDVGGSPPLIPPPMLVNDVFECQSLQKSIQANVFHWVIGCETMGREAHDVASRGRDGGFFSRLGL